MSAKKTTPKEIGETLGYIIEHMATKDDIARLDTRIERLGAKLESVETNVSAKISRLDAKLTKFEEKEIDKRLQLEVRVSAIEQHLGLDKKIAA